MRSEERFRKHLFCGGHIQGRLLLLLLLGRGVEAGVRGKVTVPWALNDGLCGVDEKAGVLHLNLMRPGRCEEFMRRPKSANRYN